MYLIPEWETSADWDRILEAVYGELFERELGEWYPDSACWPQRRDLETFKRWFGVECFSVVADLEGTRLRTVDW